MPDILPIAFSLIGVVVLIMAYNLADLIDINTPGRHHEDEPGDE
jgi:hypothetical protein